MNDQRLDKIISKAAPEILADKMLRTRGKKKKEAGSGKTKKVHSIGRFPANLRNYNTPFQKKSTHPFVTGSGKTHNVGIKLQILGKCEQQHPGPAATRPAHRPKPLFGTAMKNRYKGWIESPEGMDWTKKVKEMFVGLHNDFAALIQTQTEVKKCVKDGGEGDGEESRRKLSEVEEKLERKELQIQVAVKLYDENQKLRQEVQWLRKNIRPGRRRRYRRANTENKHT